MAQVKYPIFNYKISPTNSASGEMECWIDGVIVSGEEKDFCDNYFGENTLTSFNSFRNSITEAAPTKLKVNVNSTGGSLLEGIAIHDFIKDCSSKGMDVTMCVMGIAASSASLPIMAVPKEKRQMTENSFLLVHNCSGGISGTVNEIESYAETMRNMNNTIVNIYAAATSTSKADWQEMMDKETMITAKEAVKMGIISDTKPKANFKNSIPTDEWFFKNKSPMEIYNSYVPKENDMQDLFKKLTDVINNGFNIMGEKSKLPKEDVTNAINTLNTEITNAFTEIANGMEAKVQDGIKAYLAGDEFKAAVTALIPTTTPTDTSAFVTKEELKNAVTEINSGVANAIIQNVGHAVTDTQTPKKEKQKISSPY